jgi:hypothetical protein
VAESLLPPLPTLLSSIADKLDRVVVLCGVAKDLLEDGVVDEAFDFLVVAGALVTGRGVAVEISIVTKSSVLLGLLDPKNTEVAAIAAAFKLLGMGVLATVVVVGVVDVDPDEAVAAVDAALAVLLWLVLLRFPLPGGRPRPRGTTRSGGGGGIIASDAVITVEWAGSSVDGAEVLSISFDWVIGVGLTSITWSTLTSSIFIGMEAVIAVSFVIYVVLTSCR